MNANQHVLIEGNKTLDLRATEYYLKYDDPKQKIPSLWNQISHLTPDNYLVLMNGDKVLRQDTTYNGTMVYRLNSFDKLIRFKIPNVVQVPPPVKKIVQVLPPVSSVKTTSMHNQILNKYIEDHNIPAEEVAHPKLVLFNVELHEKLDALYREACGATHESCVNLVLAFIQKDIKVIDSELKELYYWNAVEKLWMRGNIKVLISLISRISPIAKEKYTDISKKLSLIKDTESKEYKELELYKLGLGKLYFNLGNTPFIKSVIDILLNYLVDLTFYDKLESNIYILAFKGGKIVDLRTKKIRDRTRDDYCTYEIPIIYKENYHNPISEKFFDDIMLGDIEKIKYLQLVLGSCITGDISLRQIFMFIGSEAQNGKSTLFLIMNAILGNYFVSVEQSVFLESKNFKQNKDPSHHTAYLLPMIHARMVTASEFQAHDMFNAEFMKRWAGGDLMPCRGCHQNQGNAFRPIGNAVLASNKVPTAIIDQALIERLILFPFLCKFVPEPTESFHRKKDPNFTVNILKNEEALSGFLSWLVEGASILFSGVHPPIPASIKMKTNDYIEEQNIFHKFKAEMLEVPLVPFSEINGKTKIPNEWRIGATELFKSFTEWCRLDLKMYKGIPNNTDFGIDMKKILQHGKTGSIYYCCKYRVENVIDQEENTQNNRAIQDQLKNHSIPIINPI